MVNFLNWLASTLWGPFTMILIFGVGIFYSIKTRFYSIRKLGYVLKNTLGKIFEKNASKGEGTMTPFQAVATALAGCVGNGNIAGVASAIAIGGPGAVFWMWVTAIFGMTTKFVEVTLSVHFREKDKLGNFYGGPMYYIEKGLGKKWKPLAKFYALMMVIGALGTAAFVQPYTMSQAMETIFHIPPVYTVTIAVILTGVVIIGGFKRIGRFCEKITPIMASLYIIASLGVILFNISRLPEVFGLIFRYAFQPLPAVGGFVGSTIQMAMRRGVARGTFSNEAGMGSTPIVHATAVTDHPVRQGLFGIFEVFIDTIVICTMTALVILLSGKDIWSSGLNGADLTIAAFSTLYGSVGGYIVAISVLLFAYSTMVGYSIEYETSVVYFFGQKSVKLFRWLYLIPPFFTIGKTTEMIWTVVDIATGILILPNLIALTMLSGIFIKLFKDFEDNIMPSELKASKTKA